MVETKTSLRLKCLRSDNGGEYIDRGFKEYCAANGIRMEKTNVRTSQQNGVAERMNRTINERARSMRLHSGLPTAFWADAVNTAVYLINRGPSVPLEYRLPEEILSGKEVKLAHLKVFGCVSYVCRCLILSGLLCLFSFWASGPFVTSFEFGSRTLSAFILSSL